MSESRTLANTKTDDLHAAMLNARDHLTEQDGPEAARTFTDLLETCLAAPDWDSLLEDGIAALRRGEWKQVRARLDEHEYAA